MKQIQCKKTPIEKKELTFEDVTMKIIVLGKKTASRALCCSEELINFTLKRLEIRFNVLEDKYGITQIVREENRIKFVRKSYEIFLHFKLPCCDKNIVHDFYKQFLSLIDKVLDVRFFVTNLTINQYRLIHQAKKIAKNEINLFISENDIKRFNQHFSYDYMIPFDLRYCIEKKIQLPYAIKFLLNLLDQNIDLVNEIGKHVYVILGK